MKTWCFIVINKYCNKGQFYPLGGEIGVISEHKERGIYCKGTGRRAWWLYIYKEEESKEGGFLLNCPNVDLPKKASQ